MGEKPYPKWNGYDRDRVYKKKTGIQAIAYEYLIFLLSGGNCLDNKLDTPDPM